MSHLAPTVRDRDESDDARRVVAALAAECDSVVHLPGSELYEQGRAAWNTSVDQRPAAVALPRSVEDLRRVVRSAARHGLQVTTQATGHAAAALAQHPLDRVVLVRTGALRGVHVDPVARVARVEAGAQWQDVVEAAAPYGLAALHGSAPDVGVVGYTLGGGMSWYARQHGFASNHVVGVELVDASGEVVRADAESHSDLFWALRGGAGRFGVVSTIEVELLPYADVHAGMMIWDVSRVAEVLPAYAAWSRTAPDEVTASFRILRLPPLPELPPFLSGRTVVVLDAAVLLDDAAADEVLTPFRQLVPEVDTFGRVPASALTGLHMDPPEPSPGVGDGTVLQQLDDDAVAAFLAVVGAGVESPLTVAELRLLGGALGRVPSGAGALRRVEGSHAAFFLSMAPTPEVAAVAEQAVGAALAALAPWAASLRLLNFSERSVDAAELFDPATLARLRAVAREVDPGGLFVAHHRLGEDA